MKRAQKNFELDPTKKIFGQAKPYAIRKQKFTNKVRELIIKKQNRAKKKKVGKFDETRPKKFWKRSEKKIFLRAKPYAVSESKNSRTKFVN